MPRQTENIKTFDLNVYFKEIDKYKLLNAEEEMILASLVVRGDARARDVLVKHNLRLVVNIARNYHRPGRSMGDLIEEGNMGLIHAAGMYNPDHHTRFSTYATHWIKQSIRHFIKNTQWPMRIPAYMHTLIGKLKKSGISDPTALDTPEGRKVLIGLRKVSNIDRAVFQAKKAMTAFSLSALESPEDDDGDVIDMTPDEKCAGEKHDMLLSEDRQALKNAIGRLAERERQVIMLRYGLDGSAGKTLRELGEELGLTRERIRQIERNALDLLKIQLAVEVEEYHE